MNKRPPLSRPVFRRLVIALISGAVFVGSAVACGATAAMLLTEYNWR